MANNNVKNIQFLRNETVLGTRQDAINALETQKGNVADGSIILARYGSETNIKTLAGLVYVNGNTRTVTIIDVEGASGDVETLREEINAKLGTGVTSANNATAQLEALSGNAQSSSAETSVAGAKAYTDDKILTLDYTGVTTGDAVVITNVTEADGVVSATSANVGGLKLTGYEQGAASGAVESTDTINQAFGKVENQIAAINDVVEDLDGTITADTGYYINKVDEVNGKISGTTAALPTVGAITEAGKPIVAVEENLGTIAASAGTIQAQYVDVTDSGDLFSAATVEAVLAEIDGAYKQADSGLKDEILGDATDRGDTLGKLEDRIEGLEEGAATYTIRKDTTGLPAEIKERYTLVETKDGQSTDKQVTIDIPKDSHIVSINYITTGEHAQNLEYVYIDVSGNTQNTYVDMSELVLETEFASGVTVTDHIAHGVVDPTSEGFLTVGADGFKIQGIKAEIAAAVSGATDKIEELSGKTVTEIGSSNSSITVATAATTADDGTVKYDIITDASKVKMTGFTSTDVLSGINATSSVTEAFKEVDKVITENEQTVSAALNNLEATKVENINVNGVSGKVTNNVASVTIDGNDVVLGPNYTKPAQGSAIATGDTVDAALGKLEARVDAATSGGITGATVNSAPLAITNNVLAQTVVGKQSEATATTNEAIVVETDEHGNLTLGLANLDAGTY